MDQASKSEKPNTTDTNQGDHPEEPLIGEVLKGVVLQVSKRFLLAPEGYEPALAADRLGELKTTYKALGEAFNANLNGLLGVVTIPYVFAHAATVGKHFQRIYLAASIRALKLRPGEQFEDTKKPEWHESRRNDPAIPNTAKAEFESFAHSRAGGSVLIQDTMDFLQQSLNDETLSTAASELLLQGIVLCWGALEVLSRDTFVAFLDSKPEAVDLLLKHPVAKRRFENFKPNIDMLMSYNFNLRGKMGALLSESQDLSDLRSIKAVYEALFPRAEKLQARLDDRALRLLSLQRNLVVHRRGVIDSSFVKESGCSQVSGEHLQVSPAELERQVASAAQAADAILSAASDADI